MQEETEESLWRQLPCGTIKDYETGTFDHTTSDIISDLETPISGASTPCTDTPS